jgi:CrcB protein
MSKLLWLWVMIGGALGAGARYSVSLLLPVAKEGVRFPWATLSVNLIGCLLIGFLWQLADKNSQMNAFLVIGFLGGFTTFSSFGLDGLKLIQQNAYVPFTAYVLTSNIVGLFCVFLGVKMAELIRFGT